MNSVNSRQITAILQSACSALNFDIGEFWLATKSADQRPILKFVQLYTSPVYEDTHSLLVRPDLNDIDDDKHKISPIICRGVCDGCKIVWATTVILEGLTGRKDLPLNTAVGMPIASVGYDLCILVLLSVKPIAVTPNAIEYLGYLSRAVSENITGFISFSSSLPVSPANAKPFLGIWDISELIKKYSKDISFSILPIGPLQSFFDYQEAIAFKDIENLQIADNPYPVQNRFDFSSYLEPFDSLGPSDISSSADRIKSISQLPFVFDEGQNGNPACLVDAYNSYKKSSICQSRFHEFMMAILGISLFDAAELWFVSESNSDLCIASSIHRDEIMQMWTFQGSNFRLKRGFDVPGIVIDSSQPYWDNKYDQHPFNSPVYPRTRLARELGVKTALGVPLPGSIAGRTCGCLTLYSRNVIETEPLVITFITKAVQLISASNLNPKTLSKFGIETLIYDPPTIASYPLRVQMMGFLADSELQPSGLSDALLEAAAMLGAVESSDTLLTKNCKRREIEFTEPSIETVSKLHKLTDPCFEFPANENFLSISESADRNSNDFVQLDSNPTFNSSINNGSRQCQYPSCSKCAQGATKYCISHGGGRRCTYPGCHKGARDKLFCCAHGGGKRCSVDGCSKSAVGGSTNCVNHGGGKRCYFEGCQKSSQSGTHYCVRHGGGRQCKVPGCNKVARGRTEKCAAHGRECVESQVSIIID